MGGDFAHRWGHTKDHIAAMKAIWTGEYVEYHGKYVDLPSSICQLRPMRRPHPAIYLGSVGCPNVYRRVAEWSDGWLRFCTNIQEIVDGREQINKFARARGRDPSTINITLFAPPGMFREPVQLAEIAQAGADDAVL